MKRQVTSLWRFLKLLLISGVSVMILVIQFVQHKKGGDLVEEVLSLDYVHSVEDWPYGIKFARWDQGSQVDWNWLEILDKLIVPGNCLHLK